MKKSIFGFGGARLLLALAAFGMVFQLTGCTSGGEQNDVEAVQDVEGLDTAASIDGGGDDALLSDSLPEDALGSDVAAAPSALDEATTDTSMATTEPPSMVADEMPPTDTAMDSTSVEEPMNEISSTETPVEEPAPEPAPPKVNIPLQKVAATPWKSGGRWVNAVYFARPGDTLSGISQTIYGEDHSEELQKINPTYKSREPRPGDKVYYSSMKRPDDGTQVLTWHEENSQTPQIYVARSGDNIRTLSKELLGYDGAWKEVWSSNAAVESKGNLEEGTELRYWASAASAAAPSEQIASGNMEDNLPPPPAEPMPEAPPMEMPPAPDIMADAPPPLPEDMNAMPPPPEPSQAMNELPPPPPPMEMAPPPPPPPMDQNHSVAGESGAMDEDTMMALGTVAIAAAAIAGLLVVRRRRKQKELENQFGDSTHVGT